MYCINWLGTFLMVLSESRFSVVYHDYEVDCLSLVTQHTDILNSFRLVFFFVSNGLNFNFETF